MTATTLGRNLCQSITPTVRIQRGLRRSRLKREKKSPLSKSSCARSPRFVSAAACTTWFRAGVQIPESSFSWSNATATLLGVRLTRSEEHTSELQSRLHLVCRLLLEKKKT